MTPYLWKSDAGGQPLWVGRMEDSAYGGQDPGRGVVTIIIIIIITIKCRRRVISSVLLLKYPYSTITLQSYLCCACRSFVHDDTLVALYQDIH
jgi:hypothetical protein